MKPRIVITGMGAVTPIGHGVDAYWRNLAAGACGVGPISRFDASRLPVRIAAEVSDFDHSVLPRALARSSSLFIRYAFAAAIEAVENSGLSIRDESSRTGICMGTALAGACDFSASGAEYEKSASGRISPHLVPRAIGNMAAGHLSIHLGIHGPGLTVGTACSAGGDAVMSAALLILSGAADSVLAVGGESILCPGIVSSLAQARALSRRNEEPARASRPFDRERDGFVIGEGGGALMLESEEHAQKRGARIYGILAGWANTLDGHHITAPDPEGAGAARCMTAALKQAGMCPGEIGYVNAHGTSTILGDKAETLAMKEVFGSAPPPISSTKGATGHLMGAGGLTELIACVKAVDEGLLPPTLNLLNPDPECDLDYVPNIARKAGISAAMSNSLGFGGQNSCIIIRKYTREDVNGARV